MYKSNYMSEQNIIKDYHVLCFRLLINTNLAASSELQFMPDVWNNLKEKCQMFTYLTTNILFTLSQY